MPFTSLKKWRLGTGIEKWNGSDGDLTDRQGFSKENLTGNLTGGRGRPRIQTEEVWKVFWMVFATPEEHSTIESMAGLDL